MNPRRLLLLFLMLTPLYVAAQQGGVAFVDGQSPLTLVLKPEGDRNVATVTLFLRNDDPKSQVITFIASLQDGKGMQAKADIAPATQTLSVGEVRQVLITIKVDQVNSFSGQLVLSAKSEDSMVSRTSARPLKLNRPQPAAAVKWAIVGAGVLALFSTLISFALIAWRFGLEVLKKPMGLPTFDFSQSWATNVTVAGGVLTTLLGFAALPDQGQFMSKSAYLCLSILFAALLALSPPLYNFLRKPVEVAIPDPANSANLSGLNFMGYAGAFLLATGVTIWGVFGQLITVGLLFGELAASDLISEPQTILLQAMLSLLGVGLLIYASVSIDATVKRQAKVYTKHEEERAAMSSTDRALVPEVPPMPTWHML